MMTPPSQTIEYLAPAAVGAASFALGIVVEVPVLHALAVSASLAAGMGVGAALRLFARRLRPPRTDG